MSWDITATKIIRALVNDVAESTYTDEGIKDIALVAAYRVYSEISLDYTYTINLSTNVISPDPEDNGDMDFINLLSIKAACIILNNEAKAQAGSAISMTDGPSSISLKGVYDALADQAKNVCEAYEQAKTEFSLGNSVGGLAILSPYSPGSEDASAHSGRDGGAYFE